MRDDDIAADEIKQLCGRCGKGHCSFDIGGGNTVDGDIDFGKVLQAWGRGAQPRLGRGFPAIAVTHGADLADGTPIIIGGFYINRDEIKPRVAHGGFFARGWGCGFRGCVALLRRLNGARHAVGVLVRGEGNAAGAA